MRCPRQAGLGLAHGRERVVVGLGRRRGRQVGDDPILQLRPYVRARRYSAAAMRLIVARCSVDYAGRLSAHLSEALRLVIIKADGSVLVHADAAAATSCSRAT
jgi:hypothetical protein